MQGSGNLSGEMGIRDKIFAKLNGGSSVRNSKSAIPRAAV